MFFLIRSVMKIFTAAFEQYTEVNRVVQENIIALRLVKAFVREDFEETKFGKAVKKLYGYFVRAESRVALHVPLMMIAVCFCMIAISWFGAHMIYDGALTTGQLTSLFTYVMKIMISLMMLSMVFVMISMSIASGRRIAEVINEEADIREPQQPDFSAPDGNIDFIDVDFAYRADSGNKVLTDINLSIRSGERIGILGGTGSGKTSLVSLINRLYDVTGGSVAVGGKDVRSYDIGTLRQAVSVVLQKNMLFRGTVLENLRWGDPDASEQECVEACKMANAHEFISRLPEGYHTAVEQDGANFSGGQRQRLCIARALLKKPKILILDDSTSAVDTATEAGIRQAMATYIPDTTVLTISQRVSSVQDAHRIIVLDAGRVSGFDTHENLLHTNEIYREMYENQIKGKDDFDLMEEG
jgi:ATP-binding cassette subfamily B multidrug efflux pump